MTSNTLNKNHAVVHTTTIDVKIIRLGKKQMTLSVFRQLPERSPISFDEEDWDQFSLHPPFNYWGVVRYTWKECQQWCRYHFVWQRGSSLYRMPMPEIADFYISCEALVNQYECSGEWDLELDDCFRFLNYMKFPFGEEDRDVTDKMLSVADNFIGNVQSLDQLFIAI